MNRFAISSRGVPSTIVNPPVSWTWPSQMIVNGWFSRTWALNMRPL